MDQEIKGKIESCERDDNAEWTEVVLQDTCARATGLRRVAIVMGLVALSGCAMTPLVWNKPEATTDIVAADLAECRHLAADESWRLGWERRWPPSFYNPAFMPPYYRGGRAFWLDFPMSLEREQALVDFCMHSKGYHLEALPY